jgi:glutaredoxin 3
MNIGQLYRSILPKKACTCSVSPVRGMLSYSNQYLYANKETAMQPITMYTTGVCPYCQMAKALLKQKGVADINEIRIDTNPQVREQMMQRTGRRTVPQIYIGEVHVGGFDDLNALNQAGKLDALLAG